MSSPPDRSPAPHVPNFGAGSAPDLLDRLAAKPLVAAVALTLVALALLAPRLGAAGLWDPFEVRLLESATDPQSLHSLRQSLWQAKSFRPLLPLLPISLGTQLFGVTELGGRLPMLAVGLLSLLSLLGLGRFLGQRRGGLLAGLVLLSSPLFFLSARHVSVTLPPILLQTLAVWGLSALAWPRPERRGLDLVIGGLLAPLGLVGGLLASGSLVGLVVPLATVSIALALADGPWLFQLIYGGLAGAALGPPLRILLVNAAAPPSWRLFIATFAMLLAAAAIVLGRDRRGLGLAAAAAVVAATLLPVLPVEKLNAYSPWFGGVMHWPSSREPQLDSQLRSLGFYLFPWSGLLPLAIAAAFSQLSLPAADRPDAVAAPTERRRYQLLLPLCWFSLAYVMSTLQSALVADISYPAVVALALLLGAFLDRVSVDGRAGSVVAGLCGGLCVVMVGRDFFFSPELYLSGHLSEQLHWPGPMAGWAQGLATVAVGLGVVFGLGLGLQLPWRRRLLGLGLGLSLLCALGAVQGLAPTLAKHVSYRGLYTRYKNLGGGALGLYGVQQSSSRIYGQNSTQLFSLPDVMTFLANKPNERSFVIVGSAELGAVDREATLRGQRYFVVDDSNAQFLLLANRLLPAEEDKNPLRRMVSPGSSPPKPQLPVHATFDDKIELIGYDLPAEVARGDELVVRAYYRVLAPLTGSYRVFLHFDGMGTRWNGDHVPLGGKFATNYWSPGTYITDEHRISISRIGQPSGYYQVFTGFWPGGDGARLKVTAGDHEPDQRVRIGVLRVK